MSDQLIAAGPAKKTNMSPIFNPVSQALAYTGELSVLLGQTAREIARGGIDRRDLIEQMFLLGVNSLPIALLTTFATGAVIALYFTPFLQQYGAQSLAGGFVGLAISRELAPVLTGVTLAARAGSAIAAELGTMKVTEQVDALRALAVSPIRYLVVPRLIAAVIMLPLICMLADAVGLLGGALVAAHLGAPVASFPNSARQLLEPGDFYKGIIKTAFFGLIVALVGCQQGLATRGGATEVGQATTNAVVISIVLIYIVNYFLAYLMFSSAPVF